MSMPAIERVIPLVGHLPASIRDALARRLRELAGLCLIALSGVAAAALMTWSVQDPSLSHATSRAIRNVLGYPGAIGADLLMQILGLGAIMLILPVAVWGWRMLTHRTFDREALRLGLLDSLHHHRGRLCQLLAAWRRMAAADRAWRRRRRRAGARAGRDLRARRFHLSAGARRHPVCGDVRHLPVRERLGLAAARRRGTDADRGRRRAVRGRTRSQLGLARLGLSCRDERQGAARLAAVHGLSFAGRERAAAAHRFVRAAGAQSRRPPGAVDCPAGTTSRISTTKRDGRGRGSPRRPRPAQEGRTQNPVAQILRQVRTAVGLGADGAEGLGSPAAQQERTRSQFARAGRRARRLRRPRRNRQGQSRARS